ncbi:MAG: hypothetical protein IPL94_10605 [Tetrasphaera sp.]|nr:hypothetical protein [Tetrasphaera sp.]
MTSQPHRPAGPAPKSRITLEYPLSLGVYDKYEEAQKAVDYLSDNEFPVQDVLIVGTELKQLERVTGRLTRGRVLLGGALSGAWMGFFVGLIFALFDPRGFSLAQVLGTVAFGAIFGTVWALIGYSLTKGQRDFSSVSQIVATKYEVLCEHKHVAQGRELLAKLDPMKAARDEVARAQAADRDAANVAAQPAPGAPPTQS